MARWLSWLERRPVTAEVVGSNPIRVAEAEKFQNNLINGILAQLGEHLPYKQRVIGSSPIGPIFHKRYWQSNILLSGKCEAHLRYGCTHHCVIAQTIPQVNTWRDSSVG